MSYDVKDCEYERKLIGKIENKEQIIEKYWVKRYILEYCPHCKKIIEHHFDEEYKHTKVINK